MKTILITAVAMVCGAMGASAETWNLDQCVAYAIDHNLSLIHI